LAYSIKYDQGVYGQQASSTMENIETARSSGRRNPPWAAGLALWKKNNIQQWRRGVANGSPRKRRAQSLAKARQGNPRRI